MSRFRQSRRVTSPKRKLTWDGLLIGGTDLVAIDTVTSAWLRPPAGSVNNSIFPAAIVEPDWTLTRMRAFFNLATNNGGGQVTKAFHLCMGVIAWDGTSDDPADMNFPPAPFAELSLDWVWRGVYPFVVENTAVVATFQDSDFYQSKAQRKLSNGTGLLFVFGYTDVESGTDPVNLYITISGEIRALYRLP